MTSWQKALAIIWAFWWIGDKDQYRRAMFELAVFSDDIDQDLDHALDVVEELGLNWVEIRSAWGKNLLFQTDEELQKVVGTLQDRGFRVPSVSAPVFKSHLPGHRGETGHLFHSQERDAPEQQMALIRRAARIARLLATDKVRCFSFWRIGDDPSPFWADMLALYRMAVEVAAEEDVILVMENDFECNLGSGELAARMIEEVDSPHLRLLWDCGNAYFVGEQPYPAGYDRSKHLIGHVHVKDAMRDAASGKPRWTELGSGDVDMLGQLRALKADYQGVVSLENHFTPPGSTPEDGVRLSFAGLKKLLAGLD
jgi:sugar phosphate isomerase/epimerase